MVADDLRGGSLKVVLTMAGTARTFTCHWADLARILPITNDLAAQARRRSLFEEFDPQGHGLLFQAKTVRALYRIMPAVSGVSDMKLCCHRAWQVTRDLATPIVPIGKDAMDRNQFRVLCIYLWYYFKLWDIFVQLSETGTDSRKVNLRNFEEMLPWLRAWGVQDGAIHNPDTVFETLDRYGQGWILFEDLAEFILRRAVPQLAAPFEEESRAEAIRLLKRTSPHLLDKQWPTKDRAWNGACPPVPPPGQRRPPMPVELDGMGGGAGGSVSPSAKRRFQTQYMCSYIPPQDMPTEVPSVGSKAASRALSRALTPRPVRPPSDLQTGIHLIRSSSLPAETMRTQGLDKQALRSKLENHLDMYSTGQMRKLLKVAGGMVVGPESPSAR